MILPIFLWNKQQWKISSNIKGTKNFNRKNLLIYCCLNSLKHDYIKGLTTPHISALECCISSEDQICMKLCSGEALLVQEFSRDWCGLRLKPSSALETGFVFCRFTGCSGVCNDDNPVNELYWNLIKHYLSHVSIQIVNSFLLILWKML